MLALLFITVTAFEGALKEIGCQRNECELTQAFEAEHPVLPRLLFELPTRGSD